MCIHQGQRSVLDYAIEFRTLATDSGWNSAALIDAFVGGLSSHIKEQLITLDLPDDLDSVISLTNKIDRTSTYRPPSRQTFSRLYRPQVLSTPVQGTAGAESGLSEPMQLGWSRLSAEERERRLWNKLCLYCGGLVISSSPSL